MYRRFAYWPFLILAPAVMIAGLIVFAMPALIIVVFGGICMVMFEGSWLVVQTARKLRQTQRANRHTTRTNAKLAGVRRG